MADSITFDKVRPFVAHKRSVQSMAVSKISDQARPFAAHKMDVQATLDVSAWKRELFLAAPQTAAPHRERYRCSPKKTSNKATSPKIHLPMLTPHTSKLSFRPSVLVPINPLEYSRWFGKCMFTAMRPVQLLYIR